MTKNDHDKGKRPEDTARDVSGQHKLQDNLRRLFQKSSSRDEKEAPASLAENPFVRSTPKPLPRPPVKAPSAAPLPRPGSPLPRSPFGGTGFPTPPRFGSQLRFDILPLSDTLVCVDLSTIASRIEEALFVAIDNDDVISSLMRALHDDKVFTANMRELLDRAWQNYDFHGAALAYEDSDLLWKAVETRLEAMDKPLLEHLLVTDAVLAINLLGRTRGSVLIENSPVGLERSYLERALVFDDARIIQLARIHGSRSDPLQSDTVDRKS